MVNTAFKPFKVKLNKTLTKKKITVLQINLGKRCNLACTHCHVEASPKRTEELSPEICEQLIELINRFPQIKTVDLTGGAPEMNYGFQQLVKAAITNQKEVIVRSNLTIYFVKEFADIPEYCAENQLRIVASLPCYLEDNVDQMRGYGVYSESIKALQWLNKLGYGKDPNLILDLVYNPPVPNKNKFTLPPNQKNLEEDYKKYLKENFNINFNQLFTITNLPIGRTKLYLQNRKIYQPYLDFLESNFNSETVENLMCRNELSIDYLGNVYDCDFNQMENIPAQTNKIEKITVAKLLEVNSLDIIEQVQTANYCYGCTAGCGSSCSGSLI
ncbi:arsenosugar biosynthesis radical SAM (seleno)protein ArsS [Okeania sp. SIO2B3]|uniref:arsenosugar biosynthesis radical SAM (seleno)protein ArsS n=1 Tax=Okeania sp. SIO2B3 TaxID=2607784 RepID=UPI0013C228D7|nr:arsenosugar biosynthesis radical SAM (seleno)protein ArsS [Okeania sp. SIO2B3]NET43590.1 radical SAM/Cys-rich domain protein [Okeania sp. SIO2B3]